LVQVQLEYFTPEAGSLFAKQGSIVTHEVVERPGREHFIQKRSESSSSSSLDDKRSLSDFFARRIGKPDRPVAFDKLEYKADPKTNSYDLAIEVYDKVQTGDFELSEDLAARNWKAETGRSIFDRKWSEYWRDFFSAAGGAAYNYPSSVGRFYYGYFYKGPKTLIVGGVQLIGSAASFQLKLLIDPLGAIQDIESGLVTFGDFARQLKNPNARQAIIDKIYSDFEQQLSTPEGQGEFLFNVVTSVVGPGGAAKAGPQSLQKASTLLKSIRSKVPERVAKKIDKIVEEQLPNLPEIPSSSFLQRRSVALRNADVVIGLTDGGPGVWGRSPKRTKGIEYQEQISAVGRGAEYRVNGVWFDGFDSNRKVLLDSKDSLFRRNCGWFS